MYEIQVMCMKSRGKELNPGAGSHLPGGDNNETGGKPKRVGALAFVLQALWGTRICHSLTFHYKIQEEVNRRKKCEEV